MIKNHRTMADAASILYLASSFQSILSVTSLKVKMLNPAVDPFYIIRTSET